MIINVKLGTNLTRNNGNCYQNLKLLCTIKISISTVHMTAEFKIVP